MCCLFIFKILTRNLISISPLIESNPVIVSLYFQIDKNITKTSKIVINYIKTIIQQSNINIVKKYIPN